MAMRSVLDYERRKMSVSYFSLVALCISLVVMIAFLGWTEWNHRRFPSLQVERLTKQSQTVQNLLHGDAGEEIDRLYAIQNEITSLKFAYEQGEPILVSNQLAYESLLEELAKAGFSIDSSRTKEQIHLEIRRLKRMERDGIEMVQSPYALNAINLILLFLKSGFSYGLLIVYLIYGAYVFGWELDMSSYIPLFTSGAGRRTILLAKMIVCLKTLGIGTLFVVLCVGLFFVLLPFGNGNMPTVFDGRVWTTTQLVGQLALNSCFVFLFFTALEMILYVWFLKQEMVVLGSLAFALLGVFIHWQLIPISLIQTNDVFSLLTKGGVTVALVWFSWFWIKRKDLIV
ncbi:hypothetical protein [uncultured Dubosiella sp.]|uniref:hypothetical protein n=2 Tax=uncultured Dubosiella sp. TaxID=1937011 RepID=UPI0025B29BA7|nr:hypothetical protein [uncultured Dubosiella sp.]